VKATIFVSALLLFCAGCTSQQSEQLTQQQVDQIKSEVKLAGDSLMAKLRRLDPGWSLYFVESPDWKMINADGSHNDYQTFANSTNNFNTSVATYNWATTRQDFIVAAKDMVICSWIGKDELTFKSGDKMTYDPHSYTLIFKKIDNQWKVFYSHDSGVPVMSKVGKK
jgi:hypothetical protein